MSQLKGESGNVGILESNLFRGIFARGEMRDIMSDKAYEAYMVEAEVALARVEGQLGIIPPEAAQDIERCCISSKLNREQLRRDTTLVGLPVWGLTRQLTAQVEPKESGRFVHWGLNTHDIMDLAQALQMKKGLDLLSQQLNNVRDLLVNFAVKYRSTPMVSRTHLQHALPTTFGFRVALWLSSLDRHAARLQEIRPRALLSQVGGASGSLAAFGPADQAGASDGIRVMEALTSELGLFEPAMPWHAARDGLVETVSFLALVTGSLAKIALDIALMSMPEIAELAEPYVPHRGASSTMPQKANPVLCEAILVLNKIVRQQATLAFEALQADFERAGTGAWHVEWACIPQSFTYCSAALEHTIELLQDLRVFPENMKRNLDLSKGAIAAEHLVVAISASVGRAKAHDLVYDCCREAAEKCVSLAEVAKQQGEIKDILSDEQIDWYSTPENYLGATLPLIDRVLEGRGNSTMGTNI
ncbi:L-Aspartase-like protein [Xylogone sp. PMI_703]|nr:L-Aspartase-like protein [Xylogone sp. PMI_703]